MHRTALALTILVGITLQSAPARSAPETVDRAELRKELAAQRKLNLKRFHEYRLARVYPHNTYQPGMLNVWRDDEDHTCAVATILLKGGLENVVNSTAVDQNFVRIADVTSGPLLDWVLTSGLTQEEVVMIQYPNWQEDDPVGFAAFQSEQRRKARDRKREDARLSAGYLATERALKQKVMQDAGLDLAVARLAARPDLVAALRTSSPTRTAKR